MNPADAIILGVVSGVISAFFVQFLGSIFSRIVIPWYQNFIYRGVHLEGRWIGEQSSSRGTFGFTLDLQQKGHSVNGSYLSSDIYIDRKKRNREYTLTGFVSNNYVLLQYDNALPTQLGMGAFLFTIRDGGNELLGSMMFLQTATGNVGASNDLKLVRSTK